MTELDILTVWRPEQPKKDLSPMPITEYVFPPYLTLAGIVMLPVGFVVVFHGLVVWSGYVT